MKISDVTTSDDGFLLSFTVKGLSVAYLNTLRRTVMDYVPTLAIENVEIRKNSSILYDEVIAHRLGLLPIVTEPGTYSFRVDGESGLGSELVLTLSAKGPCTVYAEMIKSKDSKAIPTHGKTPIVKLLKDQELEFEAKAILGCGITHAKWSPGLVYYEYQADVTVDNSAQELDEHIHEFPASVIDNGKISKDKILKLGLVDAVEGICPQAVAVTYDPTCIIMHVESWGQLSPSLMVQEACQYIATALDDLSQAIKKLE